MTLCASPAPRDFDPGIDARVPLIARAMDCARTSRDQAQHDTGKFRDVGVTAFADRPQRAATPVISGPA
jgi:hypothetical protein